MKKVATIEIWVNEELEDAKQCAVKVLNHATDHYFICDGSVEARLIEIDELIK